MKTIAKEIETICLFNNQGITPIRFKYQEDDESYKVIKVDKVITKNIEKLCGNNVWIFDCQSVIDGVERLFQLKYFITDCKWVLFKI